MRSRLAAESVGRSFGRREVLRAASFWAEEGRVAALLGRNGSGKTTLLRIAAGRLRAHHGAVHWNGRALERPRLHRLAVEGLLFVPDRGLPPSAFTVKEALRAVAVRFPGGRDPVEAGERLGIGGRLDAHPTDLSGGERKRALLAMVLVRSPLCLLMDEPFAGVEPRDVEVVAGVLRELADEGAAVVITGHDVRPVLEVTDDVVWVVAGTTHHLGSPDRALSHDQFVREYLGPAYGLGSLPGEEVEP